MQHLKANGFQVSVNDVENTAPVRKKYGVPDAMQSCHTAMVEGYAVEGHVPAADILRMLKEKPKGKGLAAPGMPATSPGVSSSGECGSCSSISMPRSGTTTPTWLPI